MQAEAADSTQTNNWIHTDHLGSIAVMTDSSGAWTSARDYYPFGNERVNETQGTGSDDRFDYTGKERDEESGLMYFEARYLATDSGRFMSHDPVALAFNANILLIDPQQQNVYSYSRNNPINYYDPSGMSLKSWFEDKKQKVESVINSAANAVDVGYNFITLGAGNEAAAMAQDGVTAVGVAKVVGGVAFGTIATSLTALDIGMAAGGVAVDISVIMARQQETTAVKAAASPNFIVTPGGTAYPVPKGATGPVPSVSKTSGNVTGSAFINGSSGTNGQVNTMRIMDPNSLNPDGYIRYMNNSGQGVNPYTGQTATKAASHFPIDF